MASKLNPWDGKNYKEESLREQVHRYFLSTNLKKRAWGLKKIEGFFLLFLEASFYALSHQIMLTRLKKLASKKVYNIKLLFHFDILHCMIRYFGQELME